MRFFCDKKSALCFRVNQLEFASNQLEVNFRARLKVVSNRNFEG